MTFFSCGEPTHSPVDPIPPAPTTRTDADSNFFCPVTPNPPRSKSCREYLSISLLESLSLGLESFSDLLLSVKLLSPDKNLRRRFSSSNAWIRFFNAITSLLSSIATQVSCRLRSRTCSLKHAGWSRKNEVVVARRLPSCFAIELASLVLNRPGRRTDRSLSQVQVMKNASSNVATLLKMTSS